MASETITQADKDCALAILEADIAAGGQTPFVKTAAHYIAAYRHAAVAELVEIGQRILDRGYISEHIEEERADYLAL